MAKVYANRIMTSGGTYTIDDVPEKFKEAVIQILNDRGYEF